MPSLFRADHVGSLLRPAEVLEAHKAHAEGRLSAEQLRDIEDRAILAVLDLQRQAGLDVFTDGEYRRSSWSDAFPESVEGFVDGPMPISFQWRLPEKLAETGRTAMEDIRTVPQQAGRVVGAKLRQTRRLTGDETPFLKEHAGGPTKMTTAAASYITARSFAPGVTDKVYSRSELLREVARIVQGELETLASEGIDYIQVDNPHYPDYIPEDRRARWRELGIDPDQALADDIAADNSTVAKLDRQRHVVAMHICRGNGRSAWHTEGGYERIAEQVFGSLNVDRFLLEYDSERAGGFEPLRFMPKGKTVVLGLVTTKVGDLETQDLLLKRIDEAAKFVPIEDLALSPQCGFASVAAGNLLSWDEQRRKLELVAETARKVWG